MMFIWSYGKRDGTRPLKTGKVETRQAAVDALKAELDLTDPQVRGFKIRDTLNLIDNPKADYCDIAKERPTWSGSDLRKLQARSDFSTVVAGSRGKMNV